MKLNILKDHFPFLVIQANQYDLAMLIVWGMSRVSLIAQKILVIQMNVPIMKMLKSFTSVTITFLGTCNNVAKNLSACFTCHFLLLSK